ncbi:MAG: hypothetical protein JRG83_15575 [Deltaproteobacteria bacterium]|nr:hypothetical protein [Deltaproteobacteria bacterium]
MRSALSKRDLERLLEALNEELATEGVKATLSLTGGTVMCLAFDARATTTNIDALFQPSVKVLDAALRVAAREGLSEHWLNDDVKAYVSDRGTFEPFRELSHLKILRASAKYMLAMKCLALRTGEGYQDEEDIRYLLRHLSVRRLDDAKRILASYYELAEYPPTALAVLEELLAAR